MQKFARLWIYLHVGDGVRLRIGKRDDAPSGCLLSGQDVRVWLGNMELTGKDGGLVSLDLRCRFDELVVTAHMTIEPSDIDVDSDVLVALHALADARERGVEDGGTGQAATT